MLLEEPPVGSPMEQKAPGLEPRPQVAQPDQEKVGRELMRPRAGWTLPRRGAGGSRPERHRFPDVTGESQGETGSRARWH